MSDEHSNKTIHAVYGALVLLVGGGGFAGVTLKDSTMVMSPVTTKEVIQQELVVLKNEQLQDDMEALEEQVRRDIRVTNTERLSIQNSERIRKNEDRFMLMEQTQVEILEEVKRDE